MAQVSRKPKPRDRATCLLTLDLPEPEGPSTATTNPDRCSSGVCGMRTTIVPRPTPSDPVLCPPASRDSVVHAPPEPGELGTQRLDGGGDDGDLGDADGLSEPVLEGQVLEVDAGFSDVGEQPRERPGLVRHHDGDDLVCRGRS